jgi:hypothetical protein
LLVSSETVRIVRRSTYTDPTRPLRPGQTPIQRVDGTLVEFVDLIPVSAEDDPEARPLRATVEAGVNGEAPQGAEGTATLRVVTSQEAVIGTNGRPYIADKRKHYLAGFKAA